MSGLIAPQSAVYDPSANLRKVERVGQTPWEGALITVDSLATGLPHAQPATEAPHSSPSIETPSEVPAPTAPPTTANAAG